MNNPTVDDIAKSLRESGFPPRFGANESRLKVWLLRRVAEGRPVSDTEVEQYAESIRMPLDAVRSFVGRVSERDEESNIVGIFGLSQKDHPHRFTVNNQSLSTWCAWDALFLPAMLGQTAEVESTCPVTKTRICARISPERVEEIHPHESVLTIALPKFSGEKLESAEMIWGSFCCHVHFFVSQELAAKWISTNNRDLSVLSVEDGFKLGRLAFEHVLEYV